LRSDNEFSLHARRLASPLARAFDAGESFHIGQCFICAKGNMQRKPAKSLKEPERDLYGFTIAQKKTTKVIRQNWILGKERVLKSTRMWARRRKRTMKRKKALRKKNWFRVRIWSIV